MANKTSCTIEVYAACGSCPSGEVSFSPVYAIATNDVLLFSEAAGNGCDGEFMYFKISIPGVIGPAAYEGAFEGVLCEQVNPCANYNGLISESEHLCLASDARVFGVYHPNSSAGSNCHVVLTEY